MIFPRIGIITLRIAKTPFFNFWTPHFLFGLNILVRYSTQLIGYYATALLLNFVVDDYCLSNAMYSSIGQNIKPLACPMSDVQACILSIHTQV